MSFLFGGYRNFRTEEEVKKHVLEYMAKFPDLNEEKTIKNVTDKGSSFSFFPLETSDLRALLLFRTQLQQTWLIRTQERIYCLLDDREKLLQAEIVKWNMKLDDFKHLFETVKNRPKSDKTGYIDLTSEHQGWLYTKSLFEGYEGGVIGATGSFSGATYSHTTEEVNKDHESKP